MTRIDRLTFALVAAGAAASLGLGVAAIARFVESVEVVFDLFVVAL